jgi:UDP-N-acetylglucosamine 2-epimerase
VNRHVTTIVGARPQFIKAAPVSSALAEAGWCERLLHTGQHYDHGMSQVFFDELGIPTPAADLGIGSGRHGAQTGAMLAAIEADLLDHRPDLVLVYGDTNSTLAGALAACKLGIPLAHVEAGLRSFNRSMPEEHNRVLTDHCSDLLLCPTETAVSHLRREGITEGVHLVGDVMLDSALRFAERARARSRILERLSLEAGSYAVATVHRPYNTDDPAVLHGIFEALDHLDLPVIWPVHPRAAARLAAIESKPAASGSLRRIEPLGYLDTVELLRHARMLLTDSGGMQKEAFFFGVPCLTLRPETEWVETVSSGWNTLVDSQPSAIRAAVAALRRPEGEPPPLYGDGNAAQAIERALWALLPAASR